MKEEKKKKKELLLILQDVDVVVEEPNPDYCPTTFGALSTPVA